MIEKLDLIWGAKNIGTPLGVPEHRVTRLFDRGQLPFVKRVGKMLVASKHDMARHFITPEHVA